MECLELGLQAPTGSNRQGWRWLVVTDEGIRRELGRLYRKGTGDYLEQGMAQARESGSAQNERVFDSAMYLAENLERAPVHVIPCIENFSARKPAEVHVGGPFGVGHTGGVEFSVGAALARARLGVHHLAPEVRGGGGGTPRRAG